MMAVADAAEMIDCSLAAPARKCPGLPFEGKVLDGAVNCNLADKFDMGV